MPQNKTNHQTKPEHKHTHPCFTDPPTRAYNHVRYLSSPENKKLCHQPGANQHPPRRQNKNNIFSLERRRSSRTFRYGYLVTTSSQSPIPPSTTPPAKAVRPWASGVTNFRDVTGGVYKARERIHRSVADLRLLATPPSWGRVADPNPN